MTTKKYIRIMINETVDEDTKLENFGLKLTDLENKFLEELSKIDNEKTKNIIISFIESVREVSWKEGIKEGIKQGYEKGLKEGRLKGVEEVIKDIKKMRANGGIDAREYRAYIQGRKEEWEAKKKMLTSKDVVDKIQNILDGADELGEIASSEWIIENAIYGAEKQ